MLENDLIQLRAVEPEDLELLYLWENNPALWAVGNTRQPYSKFALKEYIAQVDTNIYESGQLRLMIVEKTGRKTVGTVDLFDFDAHNRKIAFGLYVAEEFQGRGLATSALKLIEKYVFDFLQLNQLYCHISESNTASRKMFEKEKYETNGKLKQWIRTTDGYEDIIVFQRFNPE